MTAETAAAGERYDAFISYRHVEPDRRWARWLHAALEAYRVPKALVVERHLAPRLTRVFRDEEEVPASSDLGREIEGALEASRFLIVVCSPRTPASLWVGREIERFRDLGRDDRILALLIEGEPAESFPRALREIRRHVPGPGGTTVERIDDVEPLAADVRRSRSESARRLRRAAKLRLLACVLGCRFDDLARRDESRRRRRRNAVLGGLLLAVSATFAGVRYAREAEARASAAEARAEASVSLARADDLVRENAALRARVEADRARVFGSYAPSGDRAAFAREERELAEREVGVERLVEAARGSLERAARLEAPWGGTSTETKAAFATYFVGRWREAMAARDDLRARLAREQVEAYDRDAGAQTAELEGLGTLVVDVTPGDGELFLFRYASYETVRTDPPVVPRLVPVPCGGRGHGPADLRRSWSDDPADPFHPGDPCLVVTSVAGDSPAGRAGLEPGDLVFRLNGEPCGEGLFVLGITPGSPAAVAGIEPLQRIETIDGVRVEGPYEWKHTRVDKDAGGRPLRVVTTSGGVRRTVEGPHEKSILVAVGIEAAGPVEVVSAPAGARAPMRLRCLRGGAPLDLDVPAGGVAGLTVERTAYPLVCAPASRIRAGARLTLEPDSYLVVARGSGKEDQRHPVVVPRRGAVRVSIRLRDVGFTPPGFVYVPPGGFVYGGDPQAFRSAAREDAIPAAGDDGFFIGRLEVTVGEWFRFVNDPSTLSKIRQARASGKGTPYVPRDGGSPNGFVEPGADGTYESDQDARSPVLGISWGDVRDYLLWREAAPEPSTARWRIDLPTEKEWEHAARGADGRYFPWGDRFDFSLTAGGRREGGPTWEEAGAFEIRDESPYGVLDLGGSRQEWTRDEYTKGSGTYVVRGGSWGGEAPSFFRCASRGSFDRSGVDAIVGFRLVARPRSSR